MIIMSTEMKVVLSQSIKLFSSCFQVVFKLFSSDETTDEVRTSTYVRLFIGCLVGWSNVILTCL
jgi:hypothetical protein